MYKVFIGQSGEGSYKALSACKLPDGEAPDKPCVIEETNLSNDAVRFFTVFVDTNDKSNVIETAKKMVAEKET